MSDYIQKPWGSEELLECNENYVLKKLFMKEGCSCSLQYHKVKHETIYILDGTMHLIIGFTPDTLQTIELSQGDSWVIPPGKIHRMCAHKDCLYLEASTPQLDDVVRLEDAYGRV